jgi:alpha-L-rhamnosidase
MNVLPLAFDAVPASERRWVSDSLVRDILERTNGHLDCGALGSKYLLPALTEAGRLDVAITVASQTTQPAWGIAASSGDGTLWETFERTARSRDHYFLGSAADWVHRFIGGLQQSGPAWTTFRVNPPRDDRVHRAEITHDTPLGRAAVSWRREGDAWDLSVTVPTGSLCSLEVPGHHVRPLGPGQHVLSLE